MKKSRIAKLALMGSSMAALAATLGTSTYAWYVTNSTATAGGIAVTTSASGDGNLLLAQAKPSTEGGNTTYNTLEPGNFTQTLTLSANNVVVPTNGLVPATPGTFTAPTSPDDLSTAPGTLTADATLANWVNVEGGTATASESYAEFKIWVMATSNATANYVVKVKNTTAAKRTQYAYSLDGLGTSVTNLYQSFGIDAVHALRIGVVEGTTSGTTGEYTYTVASTATYTIYDEKATDTTNYSSVATWDDPTGFDANEYFNSILGTYPVGSVTGSSTTWSVADPSATAFGSVTLDANKPVLLQFRVWLEGTDSACFDSCGGQTFAFDFSFSKTNRS